MGKLTLLITINFVVPLKIYNLNIIDKLLLHPIIKSFITTPIHSNTPPSCHHQRCILC